MADLSRDDVLKLARLARLTITDEEVEKYRQELSEILKYVEQLQNADVEGLEPTTQVTGLKNVMREDEVADYGVTPDDLVETRQQSRFHHLAPDPESAFNRAVKSASKTLSCTPLSRSRTVATPCASSSSPSNTAARAPIRSARRMRRCTLPE